MDNKTKELSNVKEELQNRKVTSEDLLKKIQELEMNQNSFASGDSLKRCPDIKPFPLQILRRNHSFKSKKWKEHIKLRNSISKVKDLKNELKSYIVLYLTLFV